MSNVVKYALIALAALVLLAVVSGSFGAYMHSRAVKKYKADKEAYTKQVNELTKQYLAEKQRADAHEQTALVLQKQVPALEAELARFGAAGQRAVERQEQAKEKHEAEVTAIRNNNDACLLCRNLCTERERISDTTDPAGDYRCAAGFCDNVCAGR